MLGARKGKLQMINIDKNSIEFTNTIHIGKRSDIESIEYRFYCGKELEGFTDKLTEQEIKNADERLWEFAKPVEDR